MVFKPKIWYPIAAVLAVVNWVGAGWAFREPVEPLHGALHVVLGLAFAYWARHLRLKRDGAGREAQLASGEAREGSDFEARLDAQEGDVYQLRQELAETQERLDFAERMLAREHDKQRIEPKP